MYYTRYIKNKNNIHYILQKVIIFEIKKNKHDKKKKFHINLRLHKILFSNNYDKSASRCIPHTAG